MADKLKKIEITLDSGGAMSVTSENVSLPEFAGLLFMAMHTRIEAASSKKPAKKTPKKLARKR